MSIIAFERSSGVLAQAGDNTASERLAEFLEELTRQVNLSTVLTGSGSPEGVVPAPPTSLYMDDAGGSGSILYIKQTGVEDTGWILV